MKKFISYLVSFLVLAVLTVPWSVFAISESRNEVRQPSCIDNIDELPFSEEYNPNSPWSISFFPFKQIKVGRIEETGPSSVREQFIDLNGDGLLDYLYAEKRDYPHTDNGNDNYRQTSECVYLNNGQGWDIAYRCIATENYVEEGYSSFRGDCALVEE